MEVPNDGQTDAEAIDATHAVKTNGAVSLLNQPAPQLETHS